MVLVFGGAFNPPTKAHLEIIKLLTTKYQNTKIILIPVSNKYQKADIINYYHRYEMLKLLTKDFINIIISNIEENKDFAGTIKSLDLLSKTYEDIILVIGMDQFLAIEKWIDYEKLLAKYPLIVINRNSDKAKIIEYKNKYSLYDITYLDLNNEAKSSAFRKEPKLNKNMLTKEVYKYIKKNKLYEER